MSLLTLLDKKCSVSASQLEVSPPKTEGTIVGWPSGIKWETHFFWKLYITLFSRLVVECEELKKWGERKRKEEEKKKRHRE